MCDIFTRTTALNSMLNSDTSAA